jgi:hypothetical protein
MYAVLILFFSATLAYAHSDEDYSRAWCAKHKGEYQAALADGTRADCMLADKVVEVEILDEAGKVYECIGQVLHYAQTSRKKAHLVLIPEGSMGDVYLARVRADIAHHKLPITLELFDSKIPISKPAPLADLDADVAPATHSELQVQMIRKPASVTSDDAPLEEEVKSVEGVESLNPLGMDQ